ncbi:MAG: adenosylmethionine--8-amino-7-oxononanoate transaminase [Acidobacteriota bacterium]
MLPHPTADAHAPGGAASADGDGAPAWAALDAAHVWHPYTQMHTAPPPIPIVAADGAYLIAHDGRRILDGISSWWVNIHGHSHPRLNRALAAQAEKMQQVMFAGFTHPAAAKLAAALADRAPGDLPHVFYSDDGSTAVEVAMKMAFQYWRNRGDDRRTLFVALDDAYHGDTFGAMAAGGVSTFHATFAALFCTVRRVATPWSADRPDAGEDLETLLAREGDRVAAVLIEPMLQGAGGMRVQPPAYVQRVRALTADHGIPLIADEIFTGFGRTGRFFACEHAGVEPDLLCVSKALTAGYLPLSATLASPAIYDAFLSEDRGRTLFHGHSFTGNALACAVALESLALFDDADRLGRVAALERRFRERLARIANLPAVAETRCLGAMAAIDVKPRGDGGYLDALGPQLAAAFLARDILLRPLGNVLYFLPPYVIDDADVERVFDAIEDVLGALGSTDGAEASP